MLWNFFRRKNNKTDSIEIGVILDKNDDIIDNNYISAIEMLHSQKEEVKEEPQGEKMKYLVVLDTSNVGDRIKLDDNEGGGDARGLPARLHNFYIVEATTTDQAKNIVMWTFQRSPGYIQRQIGSSLKVTPLGNILKTLDQTGKFWAYVAPKGSPRMPGQQAVIPKPKINPHNPDEVIPLSHAPLPPQTISDDTPPIQKPKQNPQMPDMSNMDPNNPMAVMMAAMQQMMTNMQQQPQEDTQKKNPVSIKEVKDPSSDPELMRRMASNANNGPQHKNGEVPTDDPMFNEAENNARREVQQFSSLSQEEQAEASKIDIDLNDNSDINPDTFSKLLNRDDSNEET